MLIEEAEGGENVPDYEARSSVDVFFMSSIFL